jgi:hypothetical protein
MARRQRPRPVDFKVRPITKGLNYSEQPQAIDMRESPGALNDRYEKGRLRKRSGFGPKYSGCDETIIWIDQAWSAGGGGSSALVAITGHRAWYADNYTLKKVSHYDETGSPTTAPWSLTVGNASFVPSLDIGSGAYLFLGANGGAQFPVSAEYADIGVFSGGTSEGVFAFAYTGQSVPVEFEKMRGDAPAGARCVAIYDQRVVAGGIVGTGGASNYSKIQWSSKAQWDDWSYGGGGGDTVIGDSPDWIQTMKRLGDNLIVYKERSIYIGRKTYLVDPPFRFDPAPGQGIGLAAPNSVGDLGEEHLFLGWDDVYVFSLKRLQPVGTRIREELFYGENGVNPDYIGLSTGVIAEEFDEYWLFVSTNKWPGVYGVSISNLLSNPIFNDGSDGSTPTNWTASADGDGTAVLDDDGGGTFGAGVCDITFTTGSYSYVSQDYDYAGTVIDDYKFSAVVWIKTSDASVDYRVQMATKDGSGSNYTEQGVVDSVLTSGDGLTRVVLSATVSDADAEQVVLRVINDSSGTTLSVHGAHVVRIDDLDAKYITGNTGEQECGYIQAENEVQPIPLIVEQIGSYLADTVWVFNYEENAWSQWRLPMTGFGYDVLVPINAISSLTGTIEEQTWRYDEKRIQDSSPSNLIAQPDGRIHEIADLYEADWESTFNTAIVTWWESKDFDFNKPSEDKTFARLRIFHATDVVPISVTIGISTDSGVTYQEQSVTMRSGHTETFVDFFVTGNQARFKFRTNSPGLYINGFSVKVIPRGEINPY